MKLCPKFYIRVKIFRKKNSENAPDEFEFHKIHFCNMAFIHVDLIILRIQSETDNIHTFQKYLDEYVMTIILCKLQTM
jgi:hypothetical protein